MKLKYFKAAQSLFNFTPILNINILPHLFLYFIVIILFDIIIKTF